AGPAPPAGPHPELRRSAGVAAGSGGGPGGDGRGLSHRQGPGDRAVRAGLPRAPGWTGRGEHVEGGAAREHRPDHALPAHGQARLPAKRRARGRLILASTRAAESTGGERRRAAPPGAAAAERAWDPEGPDLSVLAPPLRDALRNAVERVMLDWESVVEHAASPDEAMSHASAITNAIRSSIAGSDADLGGVPHKIGRASCRERV